jgi:hypothetical protein
VVGGVLAGAGLANDIYTDVKKGKVDFNDAMNLADDSTGVISAGLSFIPGIGVPLSLGLTGLEKLVTSGIKIGKAVADEKKKEGVKHLGFSNWMDTATNAVLPSWTTKDIGEAWHEHKAKAATAKAARKTEKQFRKEHKRKRK